MLRSGNENNNLLKNAFIFPIPPVISNPFPMPTLSTREATLCAIAIKYAANTAYFDNPA
jgi:hypothetical protein